MPALDFCHTETLTGRGENNNATATLKKPLRVACYVLAQWYCLIRNDCLITEKLYSSEANVV
jgi:hypothetical protein